MDKPNRLVVSVGGNALTLGKDKETMDDQCEAARVACDLIAQIFNTEVHLALTHGNGPQVGFILRRFEHALKAGLLHPVPLDAIGADTQGAIGYMLERLLYNRLLQLNPRLANNIATLVTQVLVDPNDPAFQDPTKPIGSWMTEQEAKNHPEWITKNLDPNSPKPWRRVVASPRPLEVINARAIKHAFDDGLLTIAGGGGGIPVKELPDGTLVGQEAVIDKDLTTALIAELVQAELMAVLTAAAGVIDPQEFIKLKTAGKIIPELTTKEARSMLPYLQKGSMGPKVEACVCFTEKTGSPSLITNFANGLGAILDGKGGTRIVDSKGIDEV